MNLIQNKKVLLTLPQFAGVMAPQKSKMLIWGRGSGKSTLLGAGMHQFVTQMPRASFFLSGSTYSQILSKTLPSTLEGLENIGVYQDYDYVVGTCGKSRGFAMPYQAPQQWKNIIHFSNGAIFQLVSQDNENSGRGLNTFGGMADEIQDQDEKKLFNSAQTTNRAQKEVFKNCSMLGAEWFVGSMPHSKTGKWVLKYKDKAKEFPKEYYFSTANYFSNPHIRPDAIKKMRDNSPSELVYRTEILNIEPDEVLDGFYANFNQKVHCYSDYDNNYLDGMIWLPKEKSFDKPFDSSQDNDVKKDEPLIVSIDFGVFNSLVVSQDRTDLREYRVLKDMWVKSPKLLDALIVLTKHWYIECIR